MQVRGQDLCTWDDYWRLQGLLANCLELRNKWAQQGQTGHAGSSIVRQLCEGPSTSVKHCMQATLGLREGPCRAVRCQRVLLCHASSLCHAHKTSDINDNAVRCH